MKRIINIFANASRSMQTLYLGIFLVALVTLKITCTIYSLDNKPLLSEYFSSNLLPELTGMIIELLLFLFVIDAIRDSERVKQENAVINTEFNRKIEIERRLRAQLRVLIRRVFQDVELSDGTTGESFAFHASEHNKNQKSLIELKSKLASEIESSTFSENLVSSSVFELDLILSLSSVNSTLSDRHMKTWMNIVFYLKQLSMKNNLTESSERLVDWIAMYDKYSYQQGLVK